MPSDSVVGYVVKAFPRLSETFVLNEILAREAAGERIAIASLRAPTDSRFHRGLSELDAPITWVPENARSAERTWAVLQQGAHDLPRFQDALGELLAATANDAVQAIEVARWALGNDVGHLHAHFATTATTVVRLASILSGLPYSFTAHAKDIFCDSVDEVALRQALSDAHHVVTVSEYNRAYLRRRFNTGADRVHRVYNGVDVHALGSLRHGDAGEPQVVSVGRLVAKKGFRYLVEAAGHLRRRGLDVPVAIGGTGVLEEELGAQIEQEGLAGQVTMLGPLAHGDVADLMASGTVFAAPFVIADDGDREGLPTVVLEAMAIGIPVVSTPVTGVPEAIIDGETGLLVPEGDSVALAEAIEALLSDADLRDRLTRGARALVEQRFTLPRQAIEMAGLRREPSAIADADEPAVAS